MASSNKKAKTDKKKHPGVGGSFLKNTKPLKGVAFYNSSLRKKLCKVDFN